MRSVVDRNVFMRRIPVTLKNRGLCGIQASQKRSTHTAWTFTLPFLTSCSSLCTLLILPEGKKKAAILAYAHNFSCFCVRFEFQTVVPMNVMESSLNVMAQGDAREGKWRGNWWMDWVASTLHTTSENGVSSISIADEHTSAASSRLNWRPCGFKWTRPFRRKTKSGFCACSITFQMHSTVWSFYRVVWCSEEPAATLIRVDSKALELRKSKYFLNCPSSYR